MDAEREVAECRLCLERVRARDIEQGLATSLGCACTNACAHITCGELYVRAKASSSGRVRDERRCEICLREMTSLPTARALARAERDNARETVRRTTSARTIDGDNLSDIARANARARASAESGGDVASVRVPNAADAPSSLALACLAPCAACAMCARALWSFRIVLLLLGLFCALVVFFVRFSLS